MPVQWKESDAEVMRGIGMSSSVVLYALATSALVLFELFALL